MSPTKYYLHFYKHKIALFYSTFKSITKIIPNCKQPNVKFSKVTIKVVVYFVLLMHKIIEQIKKDEKIISS